MQPFAPTFSSSGAGKLTRLSKTLGGLVLVLSLLTFAVAPAREILLLVPGRAIRLWSLLTAGFVTPNPLKALPEVAALLLLARIVEPIHGSAEVLRIVAASALFSGCATLALAYVLFVASPSRNESVLYARFGGFHGVVGGLLVALKQAVPDAELRPFGDGGGGGAAGGGGGLLDGGGGGGGPLLAALSLRARYAPLAFVLLGTALAVPFGWASLPYLYFGVYGAWLYLRYAQPQPGGGGGAAAAGGLGVGGLAGGAMPATLLLRGDPSPEFRFATFFPDALAPPIDALAGAAAALLRLGRASGRRGAAAAGAAGAGAAGGGGSGAWGGFGEANKALLGGGDWASVLNTAGGGLNAALAAGRAAAAGGVGGGPVLMASLLPTDEQQQHGGGAGGDDPNAQRRRERGRAALEQKLGQAAAVQQQQQRQQQQQPVLDVEGGGGGGGGGARGGGDGAAAALGGDGAAAALDAARNGPQAHALSPAPTGLGTPGVAGAGNEADTADSAPPARS